MAKNVPITVENEDEKLELMGRHNVEESLDSLKKHVDEQLKSNCDAKMVVFLYLQEEAH